MSKRSVVGTIIASLALLAGCGSDDAGTSDKEARSIPIATVEYAFVAKEGVTIEAGETIEFVVTNDGTINHEMEVLTDESRRLGKTEQIAPGTSTTLAVTFEETGVYTLICDIGDHRSRGQQAQFTVIEPTESS